MHNLIAKTLKFKGIVTKKGKITIKIYLIILLSYIPCIVHSIDQIGLSDFDGENRVLLHITVYTQTSC